MYLLDVKNIYKGTLQSLCYNKRSKSRIPLRTSKVSTEYIGIPELSTIKFNQVNNLVNIHVL